MKHIAHASFWEHYRQLDPALQRVADKNFELLKHNPRHPSLQFKKVKDFWSARVGREYRALAVETNRGLAWFWIGPHDQYDHILNR